jgi:hypothetical protein
MRFAIVAVAGLMVGMSVAVAQVSTQAVVTAVPVGAGCPGQLMARQQASGGATVWTTAYEDRGDKADWIVRPRGLGIHVEFAGSKTPVKALELRVSYLPLGLRSMPAANLTNGVERAPQEKAKTFDLDREAAMRVGGDLLVGPAATITRVHLMSATFADGSVWHASSADACSVVPSKFMLVEAKK